MIRREFILKGTFASLLITLPILFIIMTVTQDAGAIPAFTRRYNTSCTTCHEAFPRLNATGEAFRLNGFKFDDDEQYRKEEPVELGDEAYKRVWPNAVWPSDIPGQPPVALTITNDTTVDTGGTKDARFQFEFPKEGKLLYAGALGDSMSAFIEMGFSRGGGGHGEGHGGEEEGGTETEIEGWIQFEDLLGLDNAINIRAGTIGMQELGLFTARDHNRISVNSYLYSTWAMPSLDHEALEDFFGGETEFEGNPFTVHAQPGVELNGFSRNWRYAVGVVNGNGDEFGDNNSDKDVYIQLAYKLGGLGLDGSGREGHDGLESSEPWRDDSLTLSLFGYYGTSPVLVEDEIKDDKFWRLGPGFLWRSGDIQLGAGYIFGENDRPFGITTDKSVDSQSWFIESTYFAKPWLIPYVRYESLGLDLPSSVAVVEDSFPKGADQQRVVVGTKMLLRANVSLALEGRFYDKNELADETNDNDQIVCSITAAF